MTGREWKPGDVAWLTVRELDGPQHHVGLCYRGGHINPHASHGVARWVLADHTDVWSSVTDARPLVVIDPEDREQVERLTVAFMDKMGPDDADDMADALREFANPTPPIEEPTNLYAVVRDSGGHEWCHVGGHVWRSLTSTGSYMVEKHWHDADSPLAGDVVEIKSEGVVTP